MREYLMLAALAVLIGGAWYIDHDAFKRGAAEGDARAAAADTRAKNAASALEVATTANVEAYDELLDVRSRLDRCVAERVFDVSIARAAASAAESDAERIAMDRAAMRAKMLAQHAGECRDWAAAPACGSYP